MTVLNDISPLQVQSIMSMVYFLIVLFTIYKRRCTNVCKYV